MELQDAAPFGHSSGIGLLSRHALAWCSRRDLVLTLVDGATSAARLASLHKKVWLLPRAAQNNIAAAAWQPQGRLLAVKRDLSNILFLLDAEHAKLAALIAMRPQSSPVTAKIIHLMWQESTVALNRPLVPLSAIHQLPRLHSHSQQRQQLSAMPPRLIPRPLSSSTHSTASLVAETRAWNLPICSPGSVRTGPSNSGVCVVGKVSVIDASMSPNLSQFNMILQLETSEYLECTLHTISTRLLSTHHHELSSIAYTTLKLSHLIEKELAHSMTALQKEFDSFADASQRQVQSLEESFLKQEENMPPLDSLHLLLATGLAIPPLESYLCGHSLGDRGLRKWKNSFQTGYAHIESLLYGQIVPLLERIMIHLSDLFGFSQTPGKFGDIGLDASRIEACIQHVLAFVRDLTKLRATLHRDLTDFNEFFLWLTFSIESISTLDRSDDPTHSAAAPNFNTTKVCSALEKLFNMDERVSQFFGKQHHNARIPLTCSTVCASLKEALKGVTDGVWMTVEASFCEIGQSGGMRLSRRGCGEEEVLPRGWGPFVSMVSTDERVMVAVTSPTSDHVTIYQLKPSDTIATSMIPPATVPGAPALKISKSTFSVHENTMFKISPTIWKHTALVFVKEDLVVSISDQENNLSSLMHVDTRQAVFRSCSMNQMEFQEDTEPAASATSAQHDDMAQENLSPHRKAQLKHYFEMEAGHHVVYLHANSSQGVVSAVCSNNMVMAFTTS
ncbi:anaphase promoting complex subunit 4 [Podochytrium sp. JEL0797]|nr:anaphase promoting complex subunit 4 [Podochytrium sp. JEL0797]